MKNQKTPKPRSSEYQIEKPETLNRPKYRSSTDHRSSEDLPAVENLNNQVTKTGITSDQDSPKPDLGNKRADDEDQREKIIRR